MYVVITDVNDNAPQFLGLPYFASVQVDSRVGTPVVEVVAVDDDEGINGDVTYRLKGRYSNLFRVDAHTGIISVKRSLSETFAGTNVKFNLSVVASDAGTSSWLWLAVRNGLQLWPCYVKNGHGQRWGFAISLRNVIGSCFRVQDCSKFFISCWAVQNYSKTLTVAVGCLRTGLGKLVLNGNAKLNHKNISGAASGQVHSSLFCLLSGTPSLSGAALLRVSVVDRATPVFTSPFYGNLLVSEDAQPHTVVTSSVSASSPDASEVYYTIEDGDPLQEFDIDFRQGNLLTLFFR